MSVASPKTHLWQLEISPEDRPQVSWVIKSLLVENHCLAERMAKESLKTVRIDQGLGDIGPGFEFWHCHLPQASHCPSLSQGGEGPMAQAECGLELTPCVLGATSGLLSEQPLRTYHV